MKQILIVFLVSIFAVSVESCTPKAAIPSAARLSEKDYEKAIRKERHARQVRKTEALAKKYGYHISSEKREAYKSLNSQERIQAQQQEQSQMVDSLIGLRRFALRITSATIDGKAAYLPKGSSQYTSIMYLKGDTLCALLPSPFVVSTDTAEYILNSKTKKKTEIEIRVQESYETKVFYLTVHTSGRVELYGNILSSASNAGQKISGFFVGNIEPLVE